MPKVKSHRRPSPSSLRLAWPTMRDHPGDSHHQRVIGRESGRKCRGMELSAACGFSAGDAAGPAAASASGKAADTAEGLFMALGSASCGNRTSAVKLLREPENLDEKILAKPCPVAFLSARTATNDPFVYRLGLQIFILARRVRLPYGSPFFTGLRPKRGLFWFRTAAHPP